jgi:hypothetical protein
MPRRSNRAMPSAGSGFSRKPDFEHLCESVIRAPAVRLQRRCGLLINCSRHSAPRPERTRIQAVAAIESRLGGILWRLLPGPRRIRRPPRSPLPNLARLRSEAAGIRSGCMHGWLLSGAFDPESDVRRRRREGSREIEAPSPSRRLGPHVIPRGSPVVNEILSPGACARQLERANCDSCCYPNN